MTAPVCPVSRSQPLSGRAGPLLPSIPQAIDLPSAIRAANALNSYLRGPPVNNVYPPSPIGMSLSRSSANVDGGVPVGAKTGNWIERANKRVMRTDRIYQQNDDGTQNNDVWIDVQRIIHFEMVDTLSGDTLTWNFGA